MKLHKDIWYSSPERDPILLAGGKNYQRQKFLVALQYVKERSLAIDVGANIGLWSLQMAEEFDRVVAFEPSSLNVELFRRNAPKAEIHEVALGDRSGTCNLTLTPTFSCMTYIKDEEGTVPMVKLDDYCLTPDFMKIDCEGYEYFVVRGAEKTIKRAKPVIIIEQKKEAGSRYGKREKEAMEYLQSMGYVIREEIVGDYVLEWDA
jgi:FkbM family methyltransferase